MKRAYEKYEKLLSGVPDYKEFLTVDEMDASSRELAEKYPDSVSLFEFGRTRENHPLLCLKIGQSKEDIKENAKKNALMFGMPHPNEPIGSMLTEYFSAALAENEELRRELGYTWYIVKAWDADGSKMNNGWYKGPFTIRNYMRNFYRPAGYEQVEWSFPIDYKELSFHDTLPETKAMMDLIDRVKPRFIYSLHNSGFGGVYWYMSGALSEIFDDLHATPGKYGVPMHLGEPESPFCTELGKAIYKAEGVEKYYDYMERYSNVDLKKYYKEFKSGDSSFGYAEKKYNSFTLLTELPYFYDPRIEDLSLSGMTRKEAVLRKNDDAIAFSRRLLKTLEISKRYFAPQNHYTLAIENFNKNAEQSAAAEQAMVESDPAFDKPATEAEKLDNLLISKFYRALSAGMLVRANESEIEEMRAAGENNPDKREALEKGFEKALEEFKNITDFLEDEFNYRAIPIRNLIGIQLECGLRVAAYLREHPEI